jgi:hypothetical protein
MTTLMRSVTALKALAKDVAMAQTRLKKDADYAEASLDERATLIETMQQRVKELIADAVAALESDDQKAS